MPVQLGTHDAEERNPVLRSPEYSHIDWYADEQTADSQAVFPLGGKQSHTCDIDV